MRNEDKNSVLIIVCLRILLQGYKNFREIILIEILNDDNLEESDKNKDSFTLISIMVACIYFIILAIIDWVILILIFISSIKCYLNFGLGLRETLIKQSTIHIPGNNINEEENTNN